MLYSSFVGKSGRSIERAGSEKECRYDLVCEAAGMAEFLYAPRLRVGNVGRTAFRRHVAEYAVDPSATESALPEPGANNVQDIPQSIARLAGIRGAARAGGAPGSTVMRCQPEWEHLSRSFV